MLLFGWKYALDFTYRQRVRESLGKYVRNFQRGTKGRTAAVLPEPPVESPALAITVSAANDSNALDDWYALIVPIMEGAENLDGLF